MHLQKGLHSHSELNQKDLLSPVLACFPDKVTEDIYRITKRLRLEGTSRGLLGPTSLLGEGPAEQVAQLSSL